jgi:hypothetical protein
MASRHRSGWAKQRILSRLLAGNTLDSIDVPLGVKTMAAALQKLDSILGSETKGAGR